MTPSSTGSLTGQLRQICDEALAGLVPGPGRAMVEQVRAKLDVPLTVTVAGGVSSGKSTLVNALLGQQVAAVDAGECTKVVAEFRFGVPERVEVIGVDGAVNTLALERGRVPSVLGRPSEQIRSVVVHLSNALLNELAVVDTPGLNTVTDVNEQATASFLGVSGAEGERTAQAIGRADTLVFLLPMLRQADNDVLREFSRLFGGSGLSAASTVAVLSKIDRLNKGGDPLDAATPIAARIAADLRGIVSGVYPVIGLLAETCRAAIFTESDARALVEVAGIRDELDREDLLLSPEDFLRFDGLTLDRSTASTAARDARPVRHRRRRRGHRPGSAHGERDPPRPRRPQRVRTVAHRGARPVRCPIGDVQGPRCDRRPPPSLVPARRPGQRPGPAGPAITDRTDRARPVDASTAAARGGPGSDRRSGHLAIRAARRPACA